jgi:hypothetical protein
MRIQILSAMTGLFVFSSCATPAPASRDWVNGVSATCTDPTSENCQKEIDESFKKQFDPKAASVVKQPQPHARTNGLQLPLYLRFSWLDMDSRPEANYLNLSFDVGTGLDWVTSRFFEWDLATFNLHGSAPIVPSSTNHLTFWNFSVTSTPGITFPDISLANTALRLFGGGGFNQGFSASLNGSSLPNPGSPMVTVGAEFTLQGSPDPKDLTYFYLSGLGLRYNRYFNGDPVISETTLLLNVEIRFDITLAQSAKPYD